MKSDSKEQAGLHREGVGTVVCKSPYGFGAPELPAGLTRQEQLALALPASPVCSFLNESWEPDCGLAAKSCAILDVVALTIASHRPVHNFPEILEFYRLDSHLYPKTKSLQKIFLKGYASKDTTENQQKRHMYSHIFCHAS